MENIRERAKEIVGHLKKEYPDVKIALKYSNPLELLVATILSAQCTDARVNLVTENLFRKYRTAGDYAHANQKTFEQEIRSTGFYRNKAKNVIALGKILQERYRGKVPSSMEELTKLPGVARKTANVVLGIAFNKPEGIAVDTHVRRLTQRFGLTGNSDADKIEQDLMKLVPRNDWTILTILLMAHGRKVCTARNPSCNICTLRTICPSADKA
jgi:endonuclease-3